MVFCARPSLIVLLIFMLVLIAEDEWKSEKIETIRGIIQTAATTNSSFNLANNAHTNSPRNPFFMTRLLHPHPFPGPVNLYFSSLRAGMAHHGKQNQMDRYHNANIEPAKKASTFCSRLNSLSSSFQPFFPLLSTDVNQTKGSNKSRWRQSTSSTWFRRMQQRLHDIFKICPQTLNSLSD